MEWKIRKVVTVHKVLHFRDNKDRLCLSRKEGGRELTSIENYADASIKRLEGYIKKNEERLITAANCSSGNISSDRKTT